ncbi:unnamed protein product [Bursaphelenchus xylophilus]|uniref:(pine wood nematode) hypothetical protein n=1 Tax=Bursaphelenchus xylophilus TaxID=6326 RepID=A0A7I8WXH4_BURXY|nr:unnamed protein product [Bursaphelenchus xylophilus]CAG9100104.1 unnamed protein product [Bursaphelenchus xylophilus]
MAGIRVRFRSNADSDGELGLFERDEVSTSAPTQVTFGQVSVRFSEKSVENTPRPSTSSISFPFSRSKRFRRATEGDKVPEQSPQEKVESAYEVVDDQSILSLKDSDDEKRKSQRHQNQGDKDTASENISIGTTTSGTSAHSFNGFHNESEEKKNEVISDKDSYVSTEGKPEESENEETPRIRQGADSVSPDQDAYSVEAMLHLFSEIFRRHRALPLRPYRFYVSAVLILLSAVLPSFLSGLLWGFYFAVLLFLYFCVSDPTAPLTYPGKNYVAEPEMVKKINEESQREDLPKGKRVFKGWMNILNEPYNPNTFHVNSLQTVLVRLDGKLLRISRPATALLKHGFHTDPTLTETEPKMLGQSIYDLTNARIKLRPRRLARRRWFSRKYPICIKLSSMNGELKTVRKESLFAGISEAVTEENPKEIVINDDEGGKLPERMSAVDVAREADGYLSDASSEAEEDKPLLKRSVSDANLPAASGKVQRLKRNFPSTKPKRQTRTIYLFARCAREKERWFHRLRKVCNKYQVSQDPPFERRSSICIGGDGEGEKVLSRDYFLYILHNLQFNKHLEESLLIQQKVSLEVDDTILMDLGRVKWTKPEESSGKELVLVANLIASRVFYDFCRDEYWCKQVQNKIQTKLATIHLPYFIETLELSSFDIGTAIPRIERIYKPYVDEWGVWVDYEICYKGCIKLALETRVNLMRIKKHHDSVDMADNNPLAASTASLNLRATPTRYSDSELPESPETSPDEEYGSKLKLNDNTREKKKTGRKILNLVDKIASSNIFKEASELKPIRKMMEDISSTRLMLNVEITELSGTMTINVPPPPSDRLWYSFRNPPKMSVRAIPKVGDRSVVFSTLSEWIENKIVQVLEKNLVLPNMDDTIIPVMSGNELLKGPINA